MSVFHVARLRQLTVKSKSPFLVIVEIISRNYKKILDGTINHFSTRERVTKANTRSTVIIDVMPVLLSLLLLDVGALLG
jgi:hypothetical protein